MIINDCPRCKRKLLKVYSRNPNSIILPYYFCHHCKDFYEIKLIKIKKQKAEDLI